MSPYCSKFSFILSFSGFGLQPPLFLSSCSPSESITTTPFGFSEARPLNNSVSDKSRMLPPPKLTIEILYSSHLGHIAFAILLNTLISVFPSTYMTPLIKTDHWELPQFLQGSQIIP